MEGNSPGPELGYQVTRRLLRRGEQLSALFAFNDVSTIVAIRGIREHKLRVSEDTLRQPLRRMGEVAASTLLQQIQEQATPAVITDEPELVVATTAPLRSP